MVDQKLSILKGAQLVAAAFGKNSVVLNDEVVSILSKLVKEEGNETVREHTFHVLRHMMPYSSSGAVKSVIMLIKVS